MVKVGLRGGDDGNAWEFYGDILTYLYIYMIYIYIYDIYIYIYVDGTSHRTGWAFSMYAIASCSKLQAICKHVIPTIAGYIILYAQ